MENGKVIASVFPLNQQYDSTKQDLPLGVQIGPRLYTTDLYRYILCESTVKWHFNLDSLGSIAEKLEIDAQKQPGVMKQKRMRLRVLISDELYGKNGPTETSILFKEIFGPEPNWIRHPNRLTEDDKIVLMIQCLFSNMHINDVAAVPSGKAAEELAKILKQ